MRTRILFKLLMLLWLSGTVSGSAQSTYVPSGDGPGDWETVAPELSLGWCNEGMDSLADFLDDRETKAFIVLQSGRMAVEWYFDDFTQDSLWYWASAGKVVTGALIGKAADEGYLGLENPTSDYLGEGWTDCPETEPDITVLNQLTMTSGLDDGVLNPDCTLPACLGCLDDPGARWAYHNGVYSQLTEVLSEATGMGHNLYLATRLNQPIGTSMFYLPSEFNRVLFSKPRDMARFGLLALRHGIWAGDTILPPGYLAQAMSPSQALNPSYGHLWWLNGQSAYQLATTQLVLPGPLIPSAPSDLVAGLGKDDQKLYVIPSADRVIIRMGNDAGDGVLAGSSFDELLWQRLDALDAAAWTCGCNGDLNGDGIRSVADLVLLLGDFGCATADPSCPADLTGDGATLVSDVLALLAGFGVPCSP